MDYDLCQEIGCEVDLCPDITAEVDSPWNHFQLCFSETDLLTCCEHSQLSPQSELSVEPEDEEEEDDDLSAASTSSRSPSPTAKRKTTPLSKQKRLERNKTERVRTKAMGEAKRSLKTLVMESGLIDDREKKLRFTEECTLKLTVQLIDRLKREISSYTGRPSRVPQPQARNVSNQKTPNRKVKKAPKRKDKKTPDPFPIFRKAMTPSFLCILKTYRYPGKVGYYCGNYVTVSDYGIRYTFVHCNKYHATRQYLSLDP